MTLVESEGKKRTDEEPQIYKKVNNFNFKSAAESIQDIAEEYNKESTTEGE